MHTRMRRRVETLIQVILHFINLFTLTSVAAHTNSVTFAVEYFLRISTLVSLVKHVHSRLFFTKKFFIFVSRENSPFLLYFVLLAFGCFKGMHLV